MSYLIFININDLFLEDDVFSDNIVRNFNNFLIFFVNINFVFYRNFNDFFNWNFNDLFDWNFQDFFNWFLNDNFNNFLSFNGSFNWNIYNDIIDNLYLFFYWNRDFLDNFYNFFSLNSFNFLSGGSALMSNIGLSSSFQFSFSNNSGLSFKNSFFFDDTFQFMNSDQSFFTGSLTNHVSFVHILTDDSGLIM